MMRTLRWVSAATLVATLVATLFAATVERLAAQATQPGADVAAQPGNQPRALTDSVRPFLVFAPRDEMWFVVASRGKRMLLDIGRVDLEVRRDSALALAYRETVAAMTPVPVGSSFILRAPWGTERVRARAVDTWNGRIVLVLEGSTAMDSAAQSPDAVTASAELERPARGVTIPAPTPIPTMNPSCDRAPVMGIYAERVRVVRDSLEGALRADGMPIYERLARRVTVSSSQVTGCFGTARVLLAVSLRAASAEWTRERMVLVDTLGIVVPLTVEDFRFRAHDLLHAVDADGDGTDDVAAIGRAFLSGGTTVLRYVPREQRFVRVAAGFSWENR